MQSSRTMKACAHARLFGVASTVSFPAVRRVHFISRPAILRSSMMHTAIIDSAMTADVAENAALRCWCLREPDNKHTYGSCKSIRMLFGSRWICFISLGAVCMRACVADSRSGKSKLRFASKWLSILFRLMNFIFRFLSLSVARCHRITMKHTGGSFRKPNRKFGLMQYYGRLTANMLPHPPLVSDLRRVLSLWSSGDPANAIVFETIV